MLAAFTRGERMWVGLMFNRVRAEWVGGGSFSHPALPGWFLEALRRWLPRWRARRNVGWPKSSGPHAVGGRLVVFASSGFHAHGVCALIARLLKALGWGERSRARCAGASTARYHRVSLGLALQRAAARVEPAVP